MFNYQVSIVIVAVSGRCLIPGTLPYRRPYLWEKRASEETGEVSPLSPGTTLILGRDSSRREPIMDALGLRLRGLLDRQYSSSSV